MAEVQLETGLAYADALFKARGGEDTDDAGAGGIDLREAASTPALLQPSPPEPSSEEAELESNIPVGKARLETRLCEGIYDGVGQGSGCGPTCVT